MDRGGSMRHQELKPRSLRSLGLPCDTVEKWIGENPVEAGVRSIPAPIREHLRGCGRCRKERDSVLPLRALLSEDSWCSPGMRRATPKNDPLFLRAVMAQVRTEPPPIRRKEIQRYRWLRVAAAVLLGFGLISLTLDGNYRPTETDPVAPHQKSIPTEVAATTFYAFVADDPAGDAALQGFIPAFPVEDGLEIVKF